MTAKQYLQQAYHLDARINSKISQVDSLRELATKCTSVMTGMPRNPSPSTSLMADAVGKIIDLEAEINRDIDKLVDLKQEIVNVLKQLDDFQLRLLLELRYLCFQSWDEIAASMNVTTSWVFKLHRNALRAVEEILNKPEET